MLPNRTNDSPRLVSNPFVKKRNLEWHLSAPPTQKRQKSVPSEEVAERGARNESPRQPRAVDSRSAPPSSAAVEAGLATITNHLSHFSQLLSRSTLDPYPSSRPRLPISSYMTLYDAALHNPHGAHFVIHQHDHPVAGPHYDLRLQINGTSSVSWAIMYGPPGDPNSQRLNRNATETRIHALWNHLIETGSEATGSLLIWDTGSYRVLPRRSKHAPAIDPDSEIEGSDSDGGQCQGLTEQEKLHAAFANRKIRLRLDGSRLPRQYVLNLRITGKEDTKARTKAFQAASRAAPKRRRSRRMASKPPEPVCTSGSGSSGSDSDPEPEPEIEGGNATAEAQGEEGAGLSAMEIELRELEDEEVRRTNAYPGASNTIGSVYQRRWYLSLDRDACGFVKQHHKKGQVIWKDGSRGAQPSSSSEATDNRLTYPFYVRGPEHERSVVTGRSGHEILEDEGVKDYIGRQGWRPVLN